jgi:hypothetical protein
MFGSQQQYSKNLTFGMYSFCYNTTTDTYDACTKTAISKINGTLFYTLDPPMIGSYMYLTSRNVVNDICAY